MEREETSHNEDEDEEKFILQMNNLTNEIRQLSRNYPNILDEQYEQYEQNEQNSQSNCFYEPTFKQMKTLFEVGKQIEKQKIIINPEDENFIINDNLSFVGSKFDPQNKILSILQTLEDALFYYDHSMELPEVIQAIKITKFSKAIYFSKYQKPLNLSDVVQLRSIDNSIILRISNSQLSLDSTMIEEFKQFHNICFLSLQNVQIFEKETLMDIINSIEKLHRLKIQFQQKTHFQQLRFLNTKILFLNLTGLILSIEALIAIFYNNPLISDLVIAQSVFKFQSQSELKKHFEKMKPIEIDRIQFGNYLFSENLHFESKRTLLVYQNILFKNRKVTNLVLSCLKLENKFVHSLLQLTSLKNIQIHECTLNDRAIMCLRRLPNLRSIQSRENKISSNIFQRLSVGFRNTRKHVKSNIVINDPNWKKLKQNLVYSLKVFEE